MGRIDDVMCDYITSEDLNLASGSRIDDIIYDDLIYNDLNLECVR